MEIYIQPVKEDSLDGLVMSVAELFAEDGGRRDPRMDIGWPARDGATYYRRLIDDPNSLCLLALSVSWSSVSVPAGHLIGRVRRPDALRPGAEVAVLESMRVHPDFRRQGVGTELMKHFENWAWCQGANELSVTAYAANGDALNFYRNQGFDPFETTLHRRRNTASAGAAPGGPGAALPSSA